MVNDILLLQNFKILFEETIVFFGTENENECKKVWGWLREIGIETLEFCDEHPLNWNKPIAGKKILSIRNLQRLNERKNVVVVVSSHQQQNKIQILNMVMPNSKYIFTVEAFIYALYRYFKADSRWDDSYVYQLLYHRFEVSPRMVHYPVLSFNELTESLKENYPSVLVYQPAKVGSCSVANSLQKENIFSVHIHTLAKFMSCPIQDLYPKNHTIKIISLVREPIGRDLALYFESMSSDNYFSIAYEPKYMDEVIRFMKINSGMTEIDSTVLINGDEFGWFYREMLPVTGIDVYQYPFNREKGYEIIKRDNIELLLIKMERLDEMQEVIRKFVGISQFNLERYNEGKSKWNASLYEDTKKNICLPKDYVDYYYKNNAYVNHFYTQQEKEFYLKQWENNITD